MGLEVKDIKSLTREVKRSNKYYEERLKHTTDMQDSNSYDCNVT